MKANEVITEEGRRSFWSRVDVGSEEDCWLWLRARDYDGYGNYKLHGKQARSHRVAYEIAHGSIPQGMVVMHTCDNPSCCNPAHLRVGTTADNNRDRSLKGRGRPLRGEAVKTSKLSDLQVREIRQRYEDGERNIYTLGEIYNVSPSHIHHLIRGAGRREAGGPIQTRTEHLVAKLTNEQVEDIRARYAAGGITQQALADEYGVCQAAIYKRIRKGPQSP